MQPGTQVLLIAANAYLGDLDAARFHADALNAFAPDFLPALLSDKVTLCKQPEHNALLKEGLRQAGL